MTKAFDHSNCAGKCLWPRYHADLLRMESQKIFMDSKVKYTNVGTVRQTRLLSVDAQVSAAGRISMVKERLSTLTWRLHNDLANSVFDGCSKEVTNNCRVLRDSKSLLQKISENKCHGWIGRGQNILKSSEKYHWKCCDC